jgi:sugar O-acyltransferase (sialic acid O-acetyltransferase NeuD family)
MQLFEIKMPQLSSNEDDAVLSSWILNDRVQVSANDLIAIVETTKASVDITAENEGYLVHVITEGSRARPGATLAIISDDINFDINAYNAKIKNENSNSIPQWTKKAELVANKVGISISDLYEKLGHKITEADVLNYNNTGDDYNDVVNDQYPYSRRERVLLLAGGGGGGALAIDAIQRTMHQTAVGILDNNKSLHGKTVLGVPIIGSNSDILSLYKDNYFDVAINILTADINEREALYNQVSNLGIPFTNVIDPSVEIRTNVNIGSGNLIMANCFIAACTKVGDNNFFASHTCIEHHSIIGSNCTFGPRCTTSGAVTIGDKVKFGMNVAIEPYLKIGDNSLIPSGSIVTQSIPKDSVLRIQSSQKIIKR